MSLKESSTNVQTLIKMLAQMKEAYLKELHKNVDLTAINIELRKELTRIKYKKSKKIGTR